MQKNLKSYIIKWYNYIYKRRNEENGFTFKSQLFREEGEDILRISNIQNGYVDLTDIAHFSKDDYPKTNLEKYAVLPNDIVVALCEILFTTE